MEELATVVRAAVLISDDADAFKTAADDAVLDHQVCKAHVVRTTEAWVKCIASALAADANGSLAALGVKPARAVADAKALLKSMDGRDPTPKAAATLQAIHCCYGKAAPPKPGEPTTLAYRLRLFSLDRWNLWPRLTCYREWTGPAVEWLDGTNNGCERAIGWWMKERYRSMCGYKQAASVRNVSRLIAWMGNALGGAGVDLALLIK